METQIINDMWKVDELIYSFRNVLCLDDEKELEDYSNDEILCEANYILETYFEYGHRNYFMLNGEFNALEQKFEDILNEAHEILTHEASEYEREMLEEDYLQRDGNIY